MGFLFLVIVVYYSEHMGPLSLPSSFSPIECDPLAHIPLLPYLQLGTQTVDLVYSIPSTAEAGCNLEEKEESSSSARAPLDYRAASKPYLFVAPTS